MREDGLVETRTNLDDARITDVFVTQKGYELTDRIQESTKKIFVKGYTGLSDAQLQKLTQTLQVVFRNFTDD